MELPELGEKCALLNCKQLDFLPFACTYCQLIFCKDHYMSDNHICTHNTTVSISEIVHPINHYNCSYDNCSALSSVEMCCQVCKKHFCLQHRHHGCIDKDQATRDKEKDKWEAPQKEYEIAKAEADRQVDASLSRARKKPNLNKTALKVELMRLKGKATGLKGIPTADRAYFLIHPPLSFTHKSKAVFVAKQWSIGRIIDSVADMCDIPNRNNETGAKKLRLFHKNDGQILCVEMERKLQELMTDGIVMDGETLILEYMIDIDPATYQLMSVEQYKHEAV